MAANDRDEETLLRLARAFGTNDNPNYAAVRASLNSFVKSHANDQQRWSVTRQTIANWMQRSPPSFPLRNDRLILELLKYVKGKPEDILRRFELPNHFDTVVSRLIVLFEKRLKPKAGIHADTSFPVYPDSNHTVKIYQNRIAHIGRESLQQGLQGKFITLRRPMGHSVADEVSIEYFELDFINGNFFATWHVKID